MNGVTIKDIDHFFRKLRVSYPVAEFIVAREKSTSSLINVPHYMQRYAEMIRDGHEYLVLSLADFRIITLKYFDLELDDQSQENFSEREGCDKSSAGERSRQSVRGNFPNR